MSYFALVHPAARANAIEAVRNAPEGHIVTIKHKTRTLDQNALLHAVLTDISEQVSWHGQKFDVTTWKRLCVASWLREQNETAMLIPSLDGKTIDIIYEKTSRMTKIQLNSLLEWCFAFGASHDVKFRK